MKKWFTDLWNDEAKFAATIKNLVVVSLFIAGGVIKRSWVHIGGLSPEELENMGLVLQALAVVVATGGLTAFIARKMNGNPKPPEEKKP